jgi:hypothetical protein
LANIVGGAAVRTNGVYGVGDGEDLVGALRADANDRGEWLWRLEQGKVQSPPALRRRGAEV